MKVFTAVLFLFLVLSPSVFAGELKDDSAPVVCCAEFDAGRLLTLSAKAVPGAASLITCGVKCTVHAVTSFGPDVPQQVSHTPQMALSAGNKGVASVKAKATEGVLGFNSFSSFLLRIASSSFWALVSGILRS